MIDLLDSMAVGASLLLPLGIPDITKIEKQLPSELYIPLSNLLLSIEKLHTEGLVVQKTLNTDDIKRFNDIISGDLFISYSKAQSMLDDAGADIDTSVLNIESTGRKLFSRNRRRLSLRKSAVGILQVTPKLIDAGFGKLPGTLAEVAANLGLNFLESKRRLVIYDFEASFTTILISNLGRMIGAAEVAKRRSNLSGSDA